MFAKLLFLIIGLYITNINLQAGINIIITDTTKINRYGIGGIPIFAYDPDLGLRYGAVINLFDYGRQNIYPDYSQNVAIKAFSSTKGTSHFSALFESIKVIPTSRFIAEIAYINDKRLDFFGFNGKNAYFNNNYIDADNLLFKNKLFYSHHRRMLRVRADVHTSLPNSNWRFLLGLSYNKFEIEEINFNEISQNNLSAQKITLYKQYVDWSVIKPQEASGGHSLIYMMGIGRDTRNHRINCNSGSWFETYILVGDMLNSVESFGKHVISFRQYISSASAKTVFAYRISSQQTVFGQMPFYQLPFFYDTKQNQDGLGGAFTLRGLNRNRIVANGFLISNIELRRTIAGIRFLKLNWQIAVSAFTDVAFITQEYPIDLKHVPDFEIINHFKSAQQLPALSFGSGAYFIYNNNNIISVNFGLSPDKQFGNSGFYIGSSFLF